MSTSTSVVVHDSTKKPHCSPMFDNLRNTSTSVILANSDGKLTSPQSWPPVAPLLEAPSISALRGKLPAEWRGPALLAPCKSSRAPKLLPKSRVQLPHHFFDSCYCHYHCHCCCYCRCHCGCHCNCGWNCSCYCCCIRWSLLRRLTTITDTSTLTMLSAWGGHLHSYCRAPCEVSAECEAVLRGHSWCRHTFWFVKTMWEVAHVAIVVGGNRLVFITWLPEGDCRWFWGSFGFVCAWIGIGTAQEWP